MIKQVITRGFGNGIFTGSIKDVVLPGYDFGEELSFWTDLPPTSQSWSDRSNQSNSWVDQPLDGTIWS